jgi:hypothetical protein
MAGQIAYTDAALNAKYGAFYVTDRSRTTSRTIRVGKVHPTIESARKAIARIEARRTDGSFLFIDVVDPRAKAEA